MNYELAKQLKDAGFPIIEKADKAPQPREYQIKNLGEVVCIPTLSELIEAVERKIPFTYFGLEKHSNDWRAGTLKTGGMNEMTSGSTPEEAVAKLWLELNKK